MIPQTMIIMNYVKPSALTAYGILVNNDKLPIYLPKDNKTIGVIKKNII